MGMVTLREILADTREKHYAVGAFNMNSYEDSYGMIMGAARKRSPIIIQTSMACVKYVGLKPLVGMIRGMADTFDIPVALHLDHATDLDLIKACVGAGYTSVMIDASKKEYEENIAITKSVVEFAHAYGCSVEAELGKLGGREENVVVEDADKAYTNPDDVPRFVEETGIDALAVAIGTAHGFYKAEPKIDFERLHKIVAITDCPLVLHGGTGVPEEDFRRCVNEGMSKINVGTQLKKDYTDALRQALKDNPEDEYDPRPFMRPVKEACAQAIMAKIDIFGSENKA
jgi:ketose-bisphosphate aldolase